MKQHFLLAAVASILLSVSACHQTTNVAPQATATLDPDPLVGMLATANEVGSAISEADLLKNFMLYDRDRSGSITPSEFKLVYEQHDIKISDGQLRALLQRFDRDRSGSIGYEEFVEMITGRSPLPNRLQF
ncbi:EF-hand domain-containing protein [Spirosoma luteolum]